MVLLKNQGGLELAKRKRLTNVEKLIKEGRGLGIKENYKPWIRIQDVPSTGRSSRIKGIKTGRKHELLSDMERNYFYILEYSDKIQDIREQYPLLPLDETVIIAKELGIEHPKDPKTKENIVMTTDFIITMTSGGNLIEVARTIKSKDDLLDRRILEKFEIERIYWERKNIDWGIVTENEIDKTIAHNISYIHNYYDIREIDSLNEISDKEIEDLIFEYLRRIVESDESIRSISSKFDHDLSLGLGTGIALFRYLIARKIIKINLSNEIDINTKVEFELINTCIDKEIEVI